MKKAIIASLFVLAFAFAIPQEASANFQWTAIVGVSHGAGGFTMYTYRTYEIDPWNQITCIREWTVIEN